MRRQITILDVGKVGCLLALVAFCVVGVAAILRQAKDSRLAGTCTSNMILIYRGLRMYAIKHEGALPDADSWADALVEEKLIPGEDVLHCPKAGGPYGYAMNSQFSGAQFERIPNPTEQVLVFESASGVRNAHDRLTSVPDPPRHPRGNNYIFADGHGGWLQEVPHVRDGSTMFQAPPEGDETSEG